MIKTAMDAALRAGGAILEIYKRDFEVEFKADSSPLTEADKAAHCIICDALEDIGLPVLSEESKAVSYEERKGWEKYWLVDPLDGTKEFIKKNGEFTVNIALIEAGRPVMGVVYAPVLGTVYCGMLDVEGGTSEAWKGTGCAGKSVSEIMESAIDLHSALCTHQSAIRVVASRSHCNGETKAFIAELEKEGPVELVSSGSSLKLCLVAEGSADVYPRIAPTMEWDTAAAQAVVEAAGGRVVKYDPAVPAGSYLCKKLDVESGTPHPTTCHAEACGEGRSHISHSPEALAYNKENLLNPYFVVKSQASCRVSSNLIPSCTSAPIASQ